MISGLLRGAQGNVVCHASTADLARSIPGRPHPGVADIGKLGYARQRRSDQAERV
jgi:hypothetical protein